MTLALVAAAVGGTGVAVLPRYIGDTEANLVHIPMPREPVEPIWITVHKDMAHTPRVRLVLDYLSKCLREDVALLRGAPG
jgi:DNA-binding transcriptional LysR family regulator